MTEITTPLKPASRLSRIIESGLRAMFPKSLFGRSVVIIVTPLIVVQLVTTWAFYDNHWNALARILNESLVAELRIAIEELQQDPEKLQEIQEQFDRLVGIGISLFPDRIIDREAESLGESDRERFGEIFNETLRKPWLLDTKSFENHLVLQVQLASGVIQFVIPRERLFVSSTSVFLLWMTGTALVLFAVASIFMRNQIRPIRRLAESAEKLGRGDDETVETDLRYEGAREVRQATRAFNAMRRRLFRQMRQRTDMLSAVSHDLRTPLTRMKLQLAMLRDDQQNIQELQADVAEMEQMIEGYLAFARGEGSEKPRKTDLNALLNTLVVRWRREGVKLVTHIEGKMRVRLRPEAFQRCLNNLVSNARHFASAVFLTAGIREQILIILIDDNGPGIPEKMREQVFRPFFRTENSRNSQTGGSGLGLPIARDIAHLHGGDLVLTQSPHGGTRAVLTLPV